MPGNFETQFISTADKPALIAEALALIIPGKSPK